jgi:hypothetical protein
MSLPASRVVSPCFSPAMAGEFPLVMDLESD